MDRAAACPDLPILEDQALGVANYLRVAPGDVFRDDAQLTGAPEDHDGRQWVIVGSSTLDLGRDRLEIYNLEETGNGSGLVFVHETGVDVPRVLATYANTFGGNGSHLSTLATWRRAECPMAFVLVEERDEYRGYYATPGDESSRVPASTEQSWVVLGVSPAGVWRASEVSTAPVVLTVREGWPELDVGEEPALTLPLDRRSWRFEASTARKP